MGFHFRAGAIAALIFGLTAAPQSVAGAEWVALTYEEAGFSAVFPAQPTYSAETKTDMSAPYVMHYYIATAGDLIFAVGYTPYPKDDVFNVDDELKADQDNFNNGVEARLLTSRRTIYERAPGDILPALEFMSESDSMNLGFKGIVILDGPNVYMAVAGNKKGIDAAADTDRMIQNFRLLPH